VILQNISSFGYKLVLFDLPGESTPGQCVTLGGKYFVLANHFNGVGSVVVREGSDFDLAPGTHVKLEGPLGRGFDTSLTEGEVPIIVTGGTGFAAGSRLVRCFRESRVDFRMVAYSRNTVGVEDTMRLLGTYTVSRVKSWNTATSGRPTTPLDPLLVNNRSVVFFAGPGSLYESCRKELDKRGLSDVTIRVNY